MTSANDAPERDPRDFILEGSNDGALWLSVDAQTGLVFNDQPGVGDNSQDTNRFETYFFTAATPGAYSQYRLVVNETFGTTSDRPQIGEIQLFNTIIPEPASAVLLCVGGALAAALRRRRA